MEVNRKLLNASQRPAYLLRMIQEWLETNLVILVGLIAVMLTVLATQLKTGSAFTDASLLTLISLSETIAVAMQFYTSLETSLGGISRLQTFSRRTKSEYEGDIVKQVPPNWPVNGRFCLHGVNASYRYVVGQCHENHLAR